MSDIKTTGNGMQFPAVYSDEDFMAEGKKLGIMEKGLNWATGDWYNHIPWGDKSKACEDAGLNVNNAKKNADVARSIDVPLRAQLGYTRGRVIAVDGLSEEQRQSLIDSAISEKWTVKILTEERNKLLGREIPVKPADFDEHMQAMLDAIPAGAKREVKGKVKAMATYLRKEFEGSVKKAVQAKVNDEQLRLKDRSRELKERDRRIKNMMKNVTGVMSEKDFKVVLGCLHPDRECAPDRKAKAFEIFNRLKDGVNWK